MMKYELLQLFHNHLLEKLSKETAKLYTNRMDRLLDGQSLIDPLANLELDKILGNLSKIKYKNHFSQSKNALLYFCKWQDIILDYDIENDIELLELDTKKKRRKLKVVHFPDIERKIKQLKNTKLKLSYQTMIKTGLRVSELASITPMACDIEGTEITLKFVGKGGKNESATVSKEDDRHFYHKLMELINNTGSSNKIFYSAIYLQIKAKELGFSTHDLRRGYAKTLYKKTKSKTYVMEKLRHTRLKTTKIYLKSKVYI